MKELEQQFGLPLFQRLPHGMALTDAGRALLGHARSVAHSVARMQDDAQSFRDGDKGVVRIAACTSTVLQFLPADLLRCHAAWPDVKIDLQELNSPGVIEALTRGVADIGIYESTLGVVPLPSRAYHEDRLLLVVPAGHALARRREVRLEDFIDHDVLETIHDFRVVAAERDIALNVIGLRDEYQLNDPIQFVPTLDKETQTRLQPADVLQLLRDGNERFQAGRWIKKYYLHQADATAGGQHPMAVVVNCIDSRTSPEIIFDAGLGDLLTIRIAGNVISREIIGSLEIAAKLGVKLIVVKGHSSCGAIGLAMQQEGTHSIGAITGKIQWAIHQCADSHGHLGDKALRDRVARHNVENSLAEIIAGSEFLRAAIRRGEIGLVGAFHDIATRNVEFGELVAPDTFDRERPLHIAA